LEYIYHIFPAEKLDNVEAQFDELIHVKGNRHVFMADTIEDLSIQAGIDIEGLKSTLERYNGYCHVGYDEEFAKNPAFLRPVRRGQNCRYLATRRNFHTLQKSLIPTRYMNLNSSFIKVIIAHNI
jgi:hypothetical protein